MSKFSEERIAFIICFAQYVAYCRASEERATDKGGSKGKGSEVEAECAFEEVLEKPHRVQFGL